MCCQNVSAKTNDPRVFKEQQFFSALLLFSLPGPLEPILYNLKPDILCEAQCRQLRDRKTSLQLTRVFANQLAITCWHRQ